MGGIMTLVLGIFFTVFFTSLQQKELKEGLYDTMSAKADSTGASLSLMFHSIDNLSIKTYLKQWAESNTSAEYYYYAMKLRESISNSNINLSGIEFSSFVTLNDEESFIITDDGTISKENYYKDSDCEMDETAWKYISNKLETNEKTLYPIYDENNQLKKILYAMTIQSNSNNKPVYIINIPTEYLFGRANNYFLYDDNGIIASGDYSGQAQKVINEIYDFASVNQPKLLQSLIIFSYKKYSLYTIQSVAPFKILYYFPLKYPISTIISHLLIPLLLIGALIIYLCATIASILYKPIKETMTQLQIPADENDDNKSSNYDEFAVLQQNLGTIEQMNLQLERAMSENKNLIIQRYYRDLVYGIPASVVCPLTPKQIDASYAVAMVDLSSNTSSVESNEWYLHLQINYLYLFIQQLRPERDIFYLNDTYDSFFIIMNATDVSDAKKVLSKMLLIKELDAEIFISLSDVRPHISHIRDSYKEVMRLSEYRYRIKDQQVITTEDISGKRDNSFYYPLLTENRLVKAIASGDASALNIFDDLIQENTIKSPLSPDSYCNFIYSLIGTLLRTMQELKTTSEDLINRKFDYAWLYANWAQKEMVERLRTNFSEIICAIQSKQNSSDTILINKMKTFIYDHYQEDIMLIDIAEHFNISTSYCSTIFKKLENENFKSFLNNYRTKKACDFIEENPDIKVIDLTPLVGFNSPNSFIRVFGKITGMTPKVYADMVKMRNQKNFD
jgi:YesN/AraC family two-component response regulator